MNKSIKTIITISILLISINSVFANSINFKKLNNPGYQNQIKAKYDMHEVIENCYFDDNTGNILISTEDVTMAVIGDECYFDNKLVQYNNGKIKLANFDFKKESIPLLKEIIGLNVYSWAHYLLSIDYFRKYADLYEEAYNEMQEAYEYMERANAEGDEESYLLIKKFFYDREEATEKARTSALEYKQMHEEWEAKLDTASLTFEALISSRGDLNGK